ncbi:MAG: 1-aminocyclopropane-1-carboxylate deaminase/D-cysteine desulfhydrase, partial [Raineya sp.]
QPFEIITDYHFGGYAKHKPELLSFIQRFSSETQIPIEPVYTGKLFFGAINLLEKGYFSNNSRILLIHCGGILNLQ